MTVSMHDTVPVSLFQRPRLRRPSPRSASNLRYNLVSSRAGAQQLVQPQTVQLLPPPPHPVASRPASDHAPPRQKQPHKQCSQVLPQNRSVRRGLARLRLLRPRGHHPVVVPAAVVVLPLPAAAAMCRRARAKRRRYRVPCPGWC